MLSVTATGGDAFLLHAYAVIRALFEPTLWHSRQPDDGLLCRNMLMSYYWINEWLCSNVFLFDRARRWIVFKNSVIAWLLNEPTRGREWHRPCARYAFSHTHCERNFTSWKTKSGYRWGRGENIETVLVERFWGREGSNGAVQFPVDMISALEVSLRVTYQQLNEWFVTSCFRSFGGMFCLHIQR